MDLNEIIDETNYNELEREFDEEMKAEELKLSEALELHNQIMINGRMAAQHLVEMCRCLKKMRDEHLYIELGYEEFDEYCEEKAGIKARQAYNYISAFEKLGGKFIEDNAGLGITKLSLLTQMNPVERVEAVESGELEGMSTRKIEELVKKTTDQAEQISLLTDEKAEAEAEAEEQQKEVTALSEEIENLKETIEELRNKPTEIAVQMPTEEDLNKIRREAEEKIIIKLNKEKKTAVKEAKQAAEAEAEKKLKKKIEDAEKSAEAAKQEAEKQKAETEKLKAEIFSLEEAGEQLQKKLDIANGAGQVVELYFNELQRVFNSLMNAIGNATDEEQTEYKKALKRAFGEFCKVI